MQATLRVLVLGSSMLALGLRSAPAQAQEIAAKWLGQDGKDLTGGEPGPKPSDYQDIHVAVRGVPPGRAIAEIVLKGGGGGEWNSRWNSKFAMVLVRPPRGNVFDLYVEPYQRENGREFELHVKYPDGSESVAYFPGGKADPNIRASGSGAEAKWLGQDGQDRTGAGASVGPDGLEDVHLALGKIPKDVSIQAVEVASPGGTTWDSGHNPKGHHAAEFTRRGDDATRGDLFFSPDRDLSGQKLRITIRYPDDKTDVVTITAGACKAEKPAKKPRTPEFAISPARARWGGQDGVGANRGDVHVSLEGLNPSRPIVAAALSDGVVANWTFQGDGNIPFEASEWAERLSIRRTGPTTADLAFGPVRDESDAEMTLRLVDPSGRSEILRFPGGKADPNLRAPALPIGQARAKPGDDLQAMAARVGTITLGPGTYNLSRPWILDRPVRIIGEPGAIVRFSQPADQPPWTAAIKIHTGGTTLEGFAIRFAGPIRWDRQVSFGPALIGATDDRDHVAQDPKHAIHLLGLDIEGPPASTEWEEAPNTARLVQAGSGRVERCVLKGGTIALAGGPWTVLDNDCRGTVPNTYCNGLISTRFTHDLVVARNHARAEGPSGKTWRFLVLTQRGGRDKILDNIVEGLGPGDHDAHKDDNAPETILTEAYRLHFEGKPASISTDGRILTIPDPQGHPGDTGDGVAILAGPQAGQFRTVAQAVGKHVYLLDAPIDRNTTAVSIATGFVRESFEGNTVDARDCVYAMNLALAGNHFGPRVVRNRLVGGRQSFWMTAYATEEPVHWGWSHAPFLDAWIEGNTVEDAGLGGAVAVLHGMHIKSNRGRVYLSATLKGNTFRWTKAMSSALAKAQAEGHPIHPSFGLPPSIDPGEILLKEEGTIVEGLADNRAFVHAATINGKPIHEAPLGTSRRK